MMRLRLMSLILALCFGTFSASCMADETQILERIAAATVRIFARDGSLGTGSVYAKTENEILIMTNAHVAGGKRSSVKVEFWYQGRLSKKVPGVVVASVLSNQTDHDYAIVNIQRADLGSYFDHLQPIPLAESEFAPDFSKLYSAGCPQGTWQTHWIGHGTEALGDSAVKFVPMPANGRSGSGIYQVLAGGGVVQVGLVTYRTRSPGKDGTSETDGEGIAQTISHVRRHMEMKPGQTFFDHVDDSLYELVPTQECPGGVCPPMEQSITIVAPDDKYTLRYVDPSAEGRSQPAAGPVLINGRGGRLVSRPTQQSEHDIFPSLPKDLDEDGELPPVPKTPQPQEQPQRREIFPNLPRPEVVPIPIPKPEVIPNSIEKLLEPLRDIRDGQLQLRKGQEKHEEALGGLRDRLDRRMDLVEQQLEIQRSQMQQSIKDSVEGVERGIVGRLLNLPLISQVRWAVRVLFWPLVLFAIWWVPAFLLNLGPLWFLPVIRAVKGFVSAAWAGLKEVFIKKQAAPPTEQQLSEMIAEILRKRSEG